MIRVLVVSILSIALVCRLLPAKEMLENKGLPENRGLPESKGLSVPRARRDLLVPGGTSTPWTRPPLPLS